VKGGDGLAEMADRSGVAAWLWEESALRRRHHSLLDIPPHGRRRLPGTRKANPSDTDVKKLAEVFGQLYVRA
jgi:hypothetical protein